MTKFTALPKFLSVFVAMLIAFSCVAVAFTEGDAGDTGGTTTVPAELTTDFDEGEPTTTPEVPTEPGSEIPTEPGSEVPTEPGTEIPTDPEEPTEPEIPFAPAVIDVLAVFSDAIVIDEIEGGEYAILAYAEDGTVDASLAEYRNATVFEGLEPETKYAIFARYAETDTEFASESITVDVTTGAVDADPVVILTDDDVVVNHELRNIVCPKKSVEYNGKTYVVKYEIRLSESVDVSSLADGSTKFGNLVSGTTYGITAKITIAGITFYSEEVSKTLKLDQDPPSTPVPTKITGTSIEVKADAEVRYACAVKGSTDELVWSASNVFADLASETTYVIYAKYPTTDTHIESDYVSIECTTLKASAGTAPAPVLLDKNNTSIKLGAADGVATEFSIDGGETWNKTGLFTGLTASTKYEFVARYVFEEGKQDPSGISESVSVITNKRANYEASASNCAFTITTSGKVYAKSSFNFSIKGDSYTEADQYGDTRYVPVAWAYEDQSKAYTANAITVTGKIDTPETSQDITVTVTYELQKFNGTEWVTVDTVEADYSVHVSPEYNAIKAFFETFLSILLDVIPKLILSMFGGAK